MNRSYSKIRHIQESNRILEKRILGEQTEPSILPITGSPQYVNSVESATKMHPDDAAILLVKWSNFDSPELTKYLLDSEKGDIKSLLEKLKKAFANGTNDDETQRELGNKILKNKELLMKVKDFAKKHNL